MSRSLETWAGELVGAASGPFMRAHPSMEMPVEELLEVLQQFLADPPEMPAPASLPLEG